MIFFLVLPFCQHTEYWCHFSHNGLIQGRYTKKRRLCARKVMCHNEDNQMGLKREIRSFSETFHVYINTFTNASSFWQKFSSAQ